MTPKVNETLSSIGFGTVLSLIVSNPQALADAIILGALGALGAFIMTTLIQWLRSLLKK